MGLGQEEPTISEILDPGPNGSSLSSVPWGLHAEPHGTSGTLLSYDQKVMTTATWGWKAENG